MRTPFPGCDRVTRGARHARLLQALGRPPWRPAHLQITIDAAGYVGLATQLFRQGDRYLDADAVFGVRTSLVADWVRHEPGPAPDGKGSGVPFTTLDFDFVLNATTGDKP
jgi:hydroxyquinol 1,2-dioxygenase